MAKKKEKVDVKKETLSLSNKEDSSKISKEDSNKEINNTLYRAFKERKTGVVSEFFNHLVAYGGFNIQNGVMYIWGDPSLFIPLEAFVKLYRSMEEKFGDDNTRDLFYWMGQLYGRNSSLMLAKKFGLDVKDIPDFVNGATQDGLGYVELTKYVPYKDGNVLGEITGTNAVFAKKYVELFGKTKGPIDYYLAGILSGGAEPLFNKNFKIEELSCVGKGDKNCLYKIYSVDEKEKIPTLLSIDSDKLKDKTKQLALKRKSSFKILGTKEIKFGDGTFVFRGYLGINVPMYFKIILDKIILDKDKKYFNELMSFQAKNYIEKTWGKTSKDVKQIIKDLELFGYGKFDIKFAGAKKILLSNINNPYPLDYFSLFGRSKEPIDFFVCLLLKEAFAASNKPVEVKETQCIARGDKGCSFEINLI